MDEWKVGDPADWGDHVGVPDTRYMDYLKEDDEEKDEEVEDFRFSFTQFHGGFKAQNYDIAFSFLRESFEIYQNLSPRQKKELSDNPFLHRYVVELCSNIYNLGDERQSVALNIIKTQNIPVVVCSNCGKIYPDYCNYCNSCGKSFEKSPEEELIDKISKILDKIVYDKSAVKPLAERTLILMKSNDSILVNIEEIDLMNIDFTFEKKHEYFTTQYICLFSQEFHDLRIFEEFGVRNDHSRLLENETFQKSIKDTEYRTGFSFKELNGGYGDRLDDNRFDFVFTDEICITAIFDMHNGHRAVFDVDLDNLKLSKDYDEYN